MAWTHLLTVVRENPNGRAVARIERPCSHACWILFQGASGRVAGGSSGRPLTAGSDVLPLRVRWAATLTWPGVESSRGSAPPEPRRCAHGRDGWRVQLGQCVAFLPRGLYLSVDVC